MAILPDFSGVFDNSLRQSAWLAYWMSVLWTACIIVACITLQKMNDREVINVFIFDILADWFEVLAWTVWLLCAVWGVIAITLPARPRAVKRAALVFWLVLIGLHIITHCVFIVMFCKRCHTLFLNSLAGNIARDGVETFAHKFSQRSWVQDFLYVVTPVANWISAPYIFRFYHSLPPLDVLFWCGWNWVTVSFVLGVIPIMCFATCVPIILGYIHAIDCGGNGTEKCPPTKLALFYSLCVEDRMDIRDGVRKIREFEADYMRTDDSASVSDSSPSASGSISAEEGRGGTKSSSIRSYTGSESDQQRQDVKRIPSYKPSRAKKASMV